MRFSATISATLLGVASLASSSPVLTTRGQVQKAFVFATFEGGDKGNTSLDIYTSDDGINFEQYAMAAYKSASGEVRDPSIIWLHDKYWVTFTNGQRDGFGLISSTDLKNWDEVATVSVSSAVDAEKTWAPEFFQDGTDTHIIVSVLEQPKSTNNANPRLTQFTSTHFAAWIMTATNDDLTQWTTPELLDVDNNSQGKQQDHIDFFALKDGDTYHGWQKNDAGGEKHIEHLTSSSAKGPWKYVQTNNALGFGQAEGPAVTKLQNGTWIMWLDNFHGDYYYSLSSDLSTWSGKTEMPSWNKIFRHGTVIAQ
ncbi:Uu.00g114150.m01.CDS01 [Anthostomella pinea]|uniref:Endo-1,5-alpha-L-arabinanase A n=1 Tax=Anthostomella pinea TaxID=933095 RepID=A0AAI8YGM4_9PEZI|nr:Uu.00g114150.m01.CDS01 [Anthostomella pinea]